MISEDREQITLDLILGAVILVLALVFPIFFHVMHLGSTFLPMFFPIALGDMLLKPRVAAIVGFLAPFLSTFLTGMPPFYPPIAPQMAVEGAVLGGVISLLRQRLMVGVILSLVSGILFQRIVLVLMVFVIAPLFHLPPGIYTATKLISGIPGIVLQLIGIPPLVKLLGPWVRVLREVE